MFVWGAIGAVMLFGRIIDVDSEVGSYEVISRCSQGYEMTWLISYAALTRTQCLYTPRHTSSVSPQNPPSYRKIDQSTVVT